MVAFKYHKFIKYTKNTMVSRKKTGFTVVIVVMCLVLMTFIERLTLPPTTSQMELESVEFLSTSNKPTPNKPFSQDGCSLFFDSLLWHDFTRPCLNHDIRYWAGGSLEERKGADLALKDEIEHTGPLGPILAPIMYAWVRAFGNSPIAKAVDAHWGYGWDE